MGFYSRVSFPRLCDWLMGDPRMTKLRHEALTGVGGELLEIGFGTGLNLAHDPKHVRRITIESNGWHQTSRRSGRRFIKEIDPTMRNVIALLLLATPLLAAEPKVHRDLPYAEPKIERQTLNIYAPAEGKDHPIVFWIHGGGWRQGDKRGVQKKPEAFVEKGFVFVSTNYRFVPNVTVKEMTGDIARAIRWVHDHAEEYGGDPDTIFVMGHSAGAHLAALVCTDDRYLKAEGLSLVIIKGCVPVDTAVYDVVKQIESIGPPRSAMYSGVFGDAERQKDSSPITHVARGKGIPPFLILHVADRPDSKVQSGMFARALQDAGVSARAFPAKGKNHGTINSDLGLPDDEPTRALFEFLDGVLK